MKITVIFTCFNRKEQTMKCIQSLVSGNKNNEIEFIIVDDNSNDGTREAISSYNCKSEIIVGDGNLFWSGGMRKGIDYFFTSNLKTDYVLLVNDDVDFYEGIIDKMIQRSKANGDAVVVGATCDEQGSFSYGALKLNFPRKRDLYYQVMPSEEFIECDTFNCNCVLIKEDIIKTIGNFDSVYRHSLADLDYGFKVKKHGFRIVSSVDYIGVCNKNSLKGTWRDISLTRLERLNKKESVKGAPVKEWFYFMNKNFGLDLAIRYSLSPYIKILLKK